ncbi:hypothetical protein LJB85_03025 [Porphyromonadaceae bacterium OttesenSCG-928-L07]|nr:hypothetical protein [Porphyromonadaceae bacterium OttesenSCG-928-L07]MDL2252151.1 hypothetical protein [Odoribacter sp. OttesenSCG-928-J03]
MKLLLPFLMSLFLLFGCTKTDRETVSILDFAESIIREKADSSLLLLRGIDREKILDKEIEAKYALALSEALDRNYIDVDNDSLIRVAYSFYKKSDDIERKARAYYYMGRVQENRGDYKEATMLFLEAAKFAQDVEDHYLCGLAHAELGYIYEDQEIFEKVTEHYQIALDEFTKSGNLQHIHYYQNELATSYEYTENYEKALEIKQILLKSAIERADTAYILYMAQNISGIYYLQKDYAKAKAYQLDFYNRYNNGLVPDSMSNKFVLGAIYLKEGELDSARHYLADVNILNLSMDARLGIYYQLSSLEAACNNYKKAYDYFGHYYHIADSLYYARQGEALLEMELKYEKAQLEYENYRHQTKERYLLICIGVILVIGVFITIFLYKRHKRIIQERDNRIKEYLMALSEADNQLSNLDVSKEKENKLKKILEDRFDLLKSYYDIVSSLQMRPEVMQRKITELMNLNSIENDAFSILSDVVNERYPSFVANLKAVHPNLSPADINLINLIITGFSSQQLSAVYNTNSLQSVYTKKYRLSCKLGMDKNVSLRSYLEVFQY